MKVRVFNRQGQLVGPVEVAHVVKTDAQWRAQLTPEQFEVARGKGTERPFCGTLLDNKREGVYPACAADCRCFVRREVRIRHRLAELFPAGGEREIVNHEDRTYGMTRIEILCARCDAHLGHVFPDGPAPSSPALLRQFGVARVHRRQRPRLAGGSRCGVTGVIARLLTSASDARKLSIGSNFTRSFA